MASNPLTIPEASALRDQVVTHLRWATKLCARLESRGYSVPDMLWREAHAARTRLQDLLTAANYESIQHGIGKEESP